jgi:hypothetical protein
MKKSMPRDAASKIISIIPALSIQSRSHNTTSIYTIISITLILILVLYDTVLYHFKEDGLIVIVIVLGYMFVYVSGGLGLVDGWGKIISIILGCGY